MHWWFDSFVIMHQTYRIVHKNCGLLPKMTLTSTGACCDLRGIHVMAFMYAHQLFWHAVSAVHALAFEAPATSRCRTS